MATVNIGNIKLNWKGAYNGSTAYAIDDVVSYNGSSYVCIQASTGNLPTVTAYWEQMSAKGVDADLINITGTVQGDLYYNNGSAIARLAPGTANQVLKTGGSGANPSWGTLSSDYVKLAAAETTSNHSTIDVYGYFDDSTYRAYKLITQHRNAAAGAQLRCSFLSTSSSTEIVDNYFIVLHTGYSSSSGSGQQDRREWNQSQPLGDFEGTWSSNHNSNEYNHIEMTIQHPQSTTYMTSARYEYFLFSANNNGVIGQGLINSTNGTACNGIRLKTSSSQFATSFWTLYGLKK